MIMGIDALVAGMAHDCGEVLREPVWEDALSLEQAGISEGRLFSRAPAIAEQGG